METTRVAKTRNRRKSCLLCMFQEIAHDDLLTCCDQRCLQEAHRSFSCDAGYEIPREMRSRKAFLNAAKEWS